MMYGVTIEIGDRTFDTLQDFGLALLEDVKIGYPEPKTSYIPVPEADGDIDATGWLTDGAVRYGMREISFNLWPVRAPHLEMGYYSRITENIAALIRQEFSFVHGQQAKMWLPDDDLHYFTGRLRIGEKGGYSNLRIPISMTAEPWRYANEETEVTITNDGMALFSNETKQVIPTFTASDSFAFVSFEGVTHQLMPGKNIFPDIIFKRGSTRLRFSGVRTPIVVTYRNGVF